MIYGLEIVCAHLDIKEENAWTHVCGEHMDSTVEKDAVIIVNTKLVTQYLVYVTTAVDLDGRVANVIKNVVLDIMDQTVCTSVGHVNWAVATKPMATV